jgi:hypothetical protein
MAWRNARVPTYPRSTTLKPIIPKFSRSNRSSPRLDLPPSSPQPLAPLRKPAQPRQSDDEKLASFILTYTVYRDTSRKKEIQRSSPFNRVPAKDLADLFVKKCEACCAFPDFTESSVDEELRSTKQDLLSEILSGLSNPIVTPHLKSDQISSLFKMITANLCRRYPHVSLAKKPEHVLDREYSHIELVYEILDSVISFQTIPKAVVSPLITQLFINGIFFQICAYDLREQRHVLQTIALLLKQFPWATQPLFRRICRFCGPVVEDFRFLYAIPSISSILVTLVADVVKDAKTARKFFRDLLLPLHKCDNYGLYHCNLTRMIVHVIGLDKSLLREFVFFISKHWAVRSREKCSLMFNEISDVCDAFSVNFDTEIAVKLISKISMFFGDPDSDVAQQSLFLLISPSMKDILKLCPQKLIKQLHDSAVVVSTSHWLADTRHFASDLVTELLAMDPSLSNSTVSCCSDGEHEADKRRKETWALILGQTPAGLG